MNTEDWTLFRGTLAEVVTAYTGVDVVKDWHLAAFCRALAQIAAMEIEFEDGTLARAFDVRQPIGEGRPGDTVSVSASWHLAEAIQGLGVEQSRQLAVDALINANRYLNAAVCEVVETTRRRLDEQAD